MPTVIGVIPARFGSTRFPGKPLAPILDLPLIQHTYQNAARYSGFDRLLVATDSEEILQAVKNFGGEALLTSIGCQSGTERAAEVVKNNLNSTKNSIVVNIQGDWPCLEPEVIGQVVDILRTDWGADIGTAAVPIRNTRDLLNPSKVKCVLDQRSRALYFSRSPLPYFPCLGPDSPLPANRAFYCHLGIYSYRTDFLLRYLELRPSPLEQAEDLEQLRPLENGYQIKVAVVEKATCLSVDRPEDVGIIEEYLCNQNTSLSQEACSPLLARV